MVSLCGDVDYEAVAPLAKYITPVPGGGRSYDHYYADGANPISSTRDTGEKILKVSL